MTLLQTLSRLLAPAAMVSTWACASAAPVERTLPDPPDSRIDSVSPSPDLGGPFPFRREPGAYGYQVHHLTVIQIAQDTLPVLTDTLRTTARVTLQVQTYDSTLHTSPESIQALVESIMMESPGDTAGPQELLLAAVAVEIPMREESSLAAPNMTPAAIPDSTGMMPRECDLASEHAEDLARGFVLRIPPTVEPGMAWTDSTTAVTCRGGIPITSVSKSAYRVQSISDSAESRLIHVLRTTTVHVSGHRLFGTRRVVVRGTGDSETIFTYQLRAGLLLEASGWSTLGLVFETPRGVEEVTQRGSLRARLGPPEPGIPPSREKGTAGH